MRRRALWLAVLTGAGALGAPALADGAPRGQGVAFVDQSPVRLVSGRRGVAVDVFNGGARPARISLRVTGDAHAAVRPEQLALAVGHVGRFTLTAPAALGEPLRGGIVALDSDGSLARRPLEVVPADWSRTGPSLAFTLVAPGSPLRWHRVQARLGRAATGTGPTQAIVRSGDGAVATVLSGDGALELLGRVRPGEYRGTLNSPGGRDIALTVRIRDARLWLALAVLLGVALAWLVHLLHRRRVGEALAPLTRTAAQLRATVRRSAALDIGAAWDYEEPRRARALVIGGRLRGGRPERALAAVHASLSEYWQLRDAVCAAAGQAPQVHGHAARRTGWERALHRAVRSSRDLRGARERTALAAWLIGEIAKLDRWWAEWQGRMGTPTAEILAFRRGLAAVDSPAALEQAWEAAKTCADRSKQTPPAAIAAAPATAWPWTGAPFRLALVRLASTPSGVAAVSGAAVVAVGTALFAATDATFGSARDYLAAVAFGLAAELAALWWFWRGRARMASASLETELALLERGTATVTGAEPLARSAS